MVAIVSRPGDAGHGGGGRQLGRECKDSIAIHAVLAEGGELDEEVEPVEDPAAKPLGER